MPHGAWMTALIVTLCRAADRFRERIPRVQLKAVVHPAPHAEVQPVVSAGPDADGQGGVRRTQAEIRVASRAAVDLGIERPANSDIVVAGVNVVHIDRG